VLVERAARGRAFNGPGSSDRDDSNDGTHSCECADHPGRGRFAEAGQLAAALAVTSG
jgi:hypothetical protein